MNEVLLLCDLFIIFVNLCKIFWNNRVNKRAVKGYRLNFTEIFL